MKENLETVQLEYDKSTFLIDLVKNERGLLYLEISHIIHNVKEIGKIKLKPAVISDLIKVLQEYQTKLPSIKIEETTHLSESVQQKIQDRYLKGVQIKDLAIQFDQKEELVEMIIRNKGIALVPNEIPKRTYWRGRRRRK
ncbi:MAG: hypothetical protein Q8S14_08080 [Algoriphagus sp.]|uniref:hypothetical protein n=1 Tax=Algoriphagus sp. TaxID=1872435 RepID=UPI00272F2401|nr:hypothetical protein [Algoriphagus sp.]MDP2040461.1 hypothetical protein [Algoriphagus sp.]MDP3471820.1 hypothetical protein [Algoriphagus sp.]